jgi:hypothetical protein
MPYINVDIELDEIYDALTTSEKKMLVEWLDADDLISLPDETIVSGISNPDFTEVCNKLAQSYYRMSKADEETIIEIMKKYNLC